MLDPAHPTATCSPYGDAGLLVQLAGPGTEAIWQTAQALGVALRDDPPVGVVDVVATVEHVFVHFDPLRTDHAALTAVVHDLTDRVGSTAPARTFTVPVVFGGRFGPDLQGLAQSLRLRPDDVVDAHLAARWVIRFVGSPAGAPMMDGSRLAGSVPRLAVPRPRVPPGSVGLSGGQSIVYNAPSPGGWQLIGRTPARLFDLHCSPQVPYRAGDIISFERIQPDEWDEWCAPLTPASTVPPPSSRVPAA